MAEIVIGTSSWADPGFVEEWYPKDLAKRDLLGYYAERFDAVEVNSTFYAVPAKRTVERWAEVTPPHFTFDVKLHQAMSRHSATPKALPADVREDVDLTDRGRVRPSADLDRELAARYLEATAPLAEAGKLTELDDLVEALRPFPVAIELRHVGWFDEEHLQPALDWFESRGAAFVTVDVPKGKAPTLVPMIDAVTRDDLAYLRLHGRNARGWMRGRSVAERFAYKYDDGELRELGDRAASLAEKAGTVRMMFNNNRGSDAPVAAARMRELLGQEAGVT